MNQERGGGRRRTARRAVVAALAAVVLAAAGPLAAQDPKPAAPSRPTAQPQYAIGASDVLHIVVWKEPDLTLDVTVRPDGYITYPLLGDIAAATLTPAKLAESLSKQLQAYVQAPKVTVVVSQANSARFFVLGQVTRPGEFPLSGRSTVIQALALAGGLREFAKSESIVIVREDQSVIPVNYKRIAEGKDVSQNVVLMRGDTIVVP